MKILSSLVAVSIAATTGVSASYDAAVAYYSGTSCSTALYAIFASGLDACAEVKCTSNVTQTCTSDWQTYAKSLFSSYLYYEGYAYENCTGSVKYATAVKLGTCISAIGDEGSVKAQVDTSGSLSVQVYNDSSCTQLLSSEATSVAAANLTAHTCIDGTKFYVVNSSPSATRTVGALAGFAALAIGVFVSAF